MVNSVLTNIGSFLEFIVVMLRYNIVPDTSNGRLLIINIIDGKTKSVLKIDNEKISRPLIIEKNLFVIKDNSVIKLN